MSRFETEKKIVLAGNSEVFNNWHALADITEEEFLDALEWLNNDPLDEQGRMTREIGLNVTEDGEKRYRWLTGSNKEQMKMFGLDKYDESNVKGSISRLQRTHSGAGFNALRHENGMVWRSTTNISLSCRDRI